MTLLKPIYPHLIRFENATVLPWYFILIDVLRKTYKKLRHQQKNILKMWKFLWQGEFSLCPASVTGGYAVVDYLLNSAKILQILSCNKLIAGVGTV